MVFGGLNHNPVMIARRPRDRVSHIEALVYARSDDSSGLALL